MKPIIKINEVSFSYKENKILEKVNLKIESGEFVAFIGPNGSGKTTLMELIVGNLSPDRGNIWLLGKNATKYNNWDRISYIPQKVKNFNKSFPATVKEIIAANLYQKMGFIKISNSSINDKIEKALKMVNMLKYKNRQIGKLSGGQQQRVFLARGLSTSPDIILLDEPMAGVDTEAQDDIYRLLNKLNKEMKITLVMISHDIHVISEYVNKIVCFSNKKLYPHNKEDFDYEDYLAFDSRGQRTFVKEHRH
ncbi:MAG: metal ABC transporter ATP-binding protein [Halanaerobiaceae bacterium]